MYLFVPAHQLWAGFQSRAVMNQSIISKPGFAGHASILFFVTCVSRRAGWSNNSLCPDCVSASSPYCCSDLMDSKKWKSKNKTKLIRSDLLWFRGSSGSGERGICSRFESSTQTVSLSQGNTTPGHSWVPAILKPRCFIHRTLSLTFSWVLDCWSLSSSEMVST